ncbi:hypothetical protein J2W21_003681 [Sinomonas atrocyanea]|uniref:hypothetical protein n=1 Tax=Sinomonas atrocyanea TaxID=37927 RepID=UPI00277FC242|nr:hypothetical protein [Sinomonas atrocyanea]MDP9886156.1 hypothetical protein [Sinomonas atrocyanea]
MINWGSFIVVAVATILGAGSIVLFFSLAIRLGSEARDPERQRVRALLRTGSGVSYALAGAVVLYGVYLVIPYFH